MRVAHAKPPGPIWDLFCLCCLVIYIRLYFKLSCYMSLCIVYGKLHFIFCGKDMPENHGREEGRVEEQDLRGAHKIQDFFNFFICETFKGSLLELNISQFQNYINFPNFFLIEFLVSKFVNFTRI